MDREEQLALGLGWMHPHGRRPQIRDYTRNGSTINGNDAAKRMGVVVASLGLALLTLVLLVLWALDSSVIQPVAAIEPTQQQPNAAVGFRFVRVDSEGIPVLYPSCDPMTVSLDPTGAPDIAESAVLSVVTRVRELTGLDVDYVGHDVKREGGATVNISWRTPSEVPGLSGDTVGQGGSVALRSAGMIEHYVHGRIVIDSTAEHLWADSSEPLERVLLHEFGHVLGLQHSEDEKSLMYHMATPSTELTDDDLAGFAATGQGRCL